MRAAFRVNLKPTREAGSTIREGRVDVAAWLRGLGLERYEPTFRENEVDAEVLPELTESDLTTMGLPVGPRRKLLKAIAVLREGALPSPTPEQPSEKQAGDAGPSSEAER